MFRYGLSGKARKQSSDPAARAALWLSAGLLGAGMTFGTVVQAAALPPEPFKVTNIHFETNASACDMGIQIAFDTDGITSGSVRNPKHRLIYKFASARGMRATGGQTEGFLEGVEPQITELLEALGCDPSDEEEVISLEDLFDAWPDGDYTFEGRSKEARFRDQATLTHFIPAGPEIIPPADKTVVRDDVALLIQWKPVTGPILPELGPVNVAGYHVVVVETGAEASPQFDVDVGKDETSVAVPAAYLKPDTIYQFEVLASEESGNQTITEGFFCTEVVDPCELPD